MSGLSICVIANDLVNFMNNDTVENFSKLIDKIARQMHGKKHKHQNMQTETNLFIRTS